MLCLFHNLAISGHHEARSRGVLAAVGGDSSVVRGDPQRAVGLEIG
jgi:hypothetical protein